MSSNSPSPAWQPPTPEQLDEWLDRYTVRSLIGRGGMGAVYLAWQGSLDRAVAVKLLPAELGTDVSFVKRFEREAKAMARLDHPNIVRVFDFGRTEAGHFYFVMEHVDGCDVSQLIRGGEVPVAEAMDIVTQLCAALGYAHSEGIIHRDIKPSNILLDKKGRVKIADFGLARPATASPDPGLTRMTESGMVMGTLEYMAPEQLMGKNVDHRADLYAVGVLFYELLTGDVPRGAWRPPSNCRPMDSGLDQVVQRALQPKPEERYQRADEVQRDLTTVLQRKVPPVRRSDKKPALILTLTALASLGGILAWNKLTSNSTPAPGPFLTTLPASGNSRPDTKPEPPPVIASVAPVPVPAKTPEPVTAVLPDKPTPPAPVPAPSPPPETPPVVSKIQSAISLLDALPNASAASEPATSPDTSAAAPVGLPAFPEGSTMLLDFSQAVDTQAAGAWAEEALKIQDGSLSLSTRDTAPGLLAWTLPGGPVDLSGKAGKHWQIEASLTAPNSRSLLLTLQDDVGRTRSWRLKGDSFFQDKLRRHSHRLPLAEAELKSLTSGFGPRFDTAGFDLSKIVSLKLESDPAGDPELPLAWRIHRIWLLP